MVTSLSLPVVFLYVIEYVNSWPAFTCFPSMFILFPPVNTSFLGCVGVGLWVSFVVYWFLPAFTSATLSILCPLTLLLTLTLNLTVKLSPFLTFLVQVMIPFSSSPPLSVDTNVVYSGILSVMVTSLSSPVVFLYVIAYVSCWPAFTSWPSIFVLLLPVNTSFLGLVCSVKVQYPMKWTSAPFTTFSLWS